MKKILFLGAAAALVLASCSNEETVKAPEGNAISFGNAFVNNSTRADLNAENLQDFGVYGYMDEVAGVVFDNEKVFRGPSWTYDNTQYWTAGHNYWFAAVAPFGAATFTAPASLPENGEFGTLAFDNSQQVDLLYANQNKIAGQATGNAKVAFTFNHLLARTQFTFKNEATNSNVKFQVSKVKLNGAIKNGVITLGENAAWAAAEGDAGMPLDYTTAPTDITVDGTPLVSGPKYIIPFAKEYEVTFTVDVYNGTVKVNSYDKTVKIPATVAFARGNSYNFTCALTYENVVDDAEPIEFTVTAVEDWNAFDNTDIEM